MLFNRNKVKDNLIYVKSNNTVNFKLYMSESRGRAYFKAQGLQI